MKHLKTYEKYYIKDINVILKLGNITLSSIMPTKMFTNNDYLKAQAKQISIYIADIYCGTIDIDERVYNTLTDYNSRKLDIKNKYVSDLFNKIKEYLFLCHNEMKKSNPDYGTYDMIINGKLSKREGKRDLYVHEFFDYVENDFEKSYKNIVIEIKKDIKNLEYILNAEKYNL